MLAGKAAVYLHKLEQREFRWYKQVPWTPQFRVVSERAKRGCGFINELTENDTCFFAWPPTHTRYARGQAVPYIQQ